MWVRQTEEFGSSFRFTTRLLFLSPLFAFHHNLALRGNFIEITKNINNYDRSLDKHMERIFAYLSLFNE